MYADELKTVFHRDGFTMTGFVGPDPDSKEDKLYTLSDLHKLSAVFDDGQLHAGKTTICTAQWERIGNKTEDSSAYYTKADDGTVKIESVDQDEKVKQKMPYFFNKLFCVILCILGSTKRPPAKVPPVAYALSCYFRVIFVCYACVFLLNMNEREQHALRRHPLGQRRVRTAPA